MEISDKMLHTHTHKAELQYTYLSYGPANLNNSWKILGISSIWHYVEV